MRTQQTAIFVFYAEARMNLISKNIRATSLRLRSSYSTSLRWLGRFESCVRTPASP